MLSSGSRIMAYSGVIRHRDPRNGSRKEIRMKVKETLVVINLALVCFTSLMLSGQGQGDPCRNEDSNVAMRECYTREQEIVNSEADSLAKKLAAELRKEAQDFRTTSWVVSDLVLKAGLQITRSQ